MTTTLTPDERGLIACDDGRTRPLWAATSPDLTAYYDTEWGRPIRTEHGVFERLVLEGFQAGLSWATILRKREALRERFAHFNPDVLATFTAADVEEILSDARVLRNRRKVESAITNAQACIDARAHGGLVQIISSYVPDPPPPQPRSTADIPSWTPESATLAARLKSLNFRFVGPTTCYALWQAAGFINDRVLGASDLLPPSEGPQH